MRMRRKKNGAARLAACAHLLCGLPDAPKTDASADFGREAPLALEIGCGKGSFACGMAEAHPDRCFYAMERVADVMVTAVERAQACAERRPDNLRFIIADADTLPAWFAPGSLQEIYLNFSDPWPKKGYAKRRLTHRDRLRLYFSLLGEGGRLYVKTDNEGLFAFTLEELAALGCKLLYTTDDLHASPYAAGNIMTEYERNFASQGMPIHALCAERGSYMPAALTDAVAAESAEASR